MDANEKAAIDWNRSNLMNQLDVDCVAIYLRSHNVILQDHQDKLERKTISERRLYLLDLIQNQHNSWEHFCAALEHCKQKHLRWVLENSKSQHRSGVKFSEAKTLVAIGTTGNGKSTMCNVLFGHPDFFKESAQADSETRCAIAAPAMFKGKPVYVIDTPGFKDSEGNDTKNIENTVQFLKNHPYGLHGIVFVLNGQNPRIDGTDKDLIKLLCNIFKADEFWEHMCILFTRCSKDPSMKVNEAQRRTEFSRKIREIAQEMKIKLPDREMQAFFVNLKDPNDQESNKNIENLKDWLLQLAPIGRMDQMKAADAKYKEIRLSTPKKIPTYYEKRRLRFVKTSSWVEHVHGKKNYYVCQDFQHYKLIQNEIRIEYDGAESIGPEIVLKADLCEAVTGQYEETA